MNKILLLLIVSLFGFQSLHKFYMSLTDVEFNKNENSVQMVMNVFIDDIETALNEEFNIESRLTTSSEIKKIDDYCYKYLQQHFKVNINGKDKSYIFIGKEYDGDIVYFYLEINDVNELKTIGFKNSILLKYFPKQQNLIKVKIDNNRKSLFLNDKDREGLLKFE